MSGVLSGVRVVEMASWTYVPSAGAALADWGADVIKVESVEFGDPSRALVVGGFTREAARVDADFMLELGNRGKRSVAIDLKSELGREFFGRLLASADVLLTNWLPGALERARLDGRGHPRLQPRHHHRARFGSWRARTRQRSGRFRRRDLLRTRRRGLHADAVRL